MRLSHAILAFILVAMVLASAIWNRTQANASGPKELATSESSSRIQRAVNVPPPRSGLQLSTGEEFLPPEETAWMIRRTPQELAAFYAQGRHLRRQSDRAVRVILSDAKARMAGEMWVSDWEHPGYDPKQEAELAQAELCRRGLRE
jgi:hypothetical protein